MVRFRDWLPSKNTTPEQRLTVDELMALDRHDEAKERLLHRLRDHPQDLHAHLKLGDAYRNLGDAEASQQEYMFVAAAYAEDGFYDRARAVLTKASRFFPGQINVDVQMMALQRAKNLEYSRDKARKGFLADSPLEGARAIEFERIWDALSRTTLVDRISSRDFALLFQKAAVIHLEAGTVVADPTAGSLESTRPALFIVISGCLEARFEDGKGHDVSLRSFGVGEIVGASVLFDNAAWPARYRCAEASTLLELDQDGALGLVGGPEKPRELMMVLQDRANDEVVRRAVFHLAT